MKQQLTIIALLTVIMVAAGCAHKKQITPTPQTLAREEADRQLEAERLRIADSIAAAQAARLWAIEQQRIADSIAAAEEAKRLQIQTLNIPRMTVIVDMQGKQMSTPASMKWQRGVGVTVSLQPFIGMEMFRFELDREGVTVIDKMNRQYGSISYEQLAQMGTHSSMERIDEWIDSHIIEHLDEPVITLQASRANVSITAQLYTSSIQKDLTLNMRATNTTGYKQVAIEQLLQSF